jgi:predicted nucleotide-binding protein (sugar kinase/HSP70/actin superfamily)
MKIGIPRALFYYYLYPQWKNFFNALGCDVVTSPESDKNIANDGINHAVAEACFPVKVFYGHVISLRRAAPDWIFVPRLVSIEPKYYVCPKLMGLPDMIRAQVSDLPPLMDLCVDQTRGKGYMNSELKNWARRLQIKPARMIEAWQESQRASEEFYGLCQQGHTPAEALDYGEGKSFSHPAAGDITIGLLGHCYTLNDNIINIGILRNLRELGVVPVTAEMLDQKAIEEEAADLPKRMFWTMGKKMVGAALKMNRDPGIDGMIYLACFGCGPDSMVAKIIEQRMSNKPFMLLNVDEHSGEAGVLTRLEAFCDMLRRRTTHESNLSPYGQQLYCH